MMSTEEEELETKISNEEQAVTASQKYIKTLKNQLKKLREGK